MPTDSAAPSTSSGSPSSTEERLVADLIALMEKGCSPWRRPWREEGGPHVNLVSGRTYRGANPVLLSLGMQLRGSDLPFWCGWGEARRIGVAPRKGSRGVTILRPLATAAPDPAREADTHDAEAGTRVAMPVGRIRWRPVVVFNAADLVGDAEASRALSGRIHRCLAAVRQATPPLNERLARAEAILAAWPVLVLEGGTGAWYQPATDRIHLPSAESFSHTAARLATWAHEAIHSTGHSTRLARELSGSFGTDAYAREELLAELGAVLLGERLAIGSDTANHAAYLEHWCALLRQSPRLLLKLLGEARRAADLIVPEAVAADPADLEQPAEARVQPLS